MGERVPRAACRARAWRAGLPVLAALLLAGGSVGCGASQPSGAVSERSPATVAGPPDFELQALDGGTFRLREHLGREVLVLDFWATWCDPCLASMRHLEALHVKHAQEGLTVVGIAIDGPDSVAQVRAEVSKRGVTFPILLDQETRVVALYNPRASAPFSVLIGRDGSIVTTREGFSGGGASAMTAEVEAALAER